MTEIKYWKDKAAPTALLEELHDRKTSRGIHVGDQYWKVVRVPQGWALYHSYRLFDSYSDQPNGWSKYRAIPRGQIEDTILETQNRDIKAMLELLGRE